MIHRVIRGRYGEWLIPVTAGKGGTTPSAGVAQFRPFTMWDVDRWERRQARRWPGDLTEERPWPWHGPQPSDPSPFPRIRLLRRTRPRWER